MAYTLSVTRLANYMLHLLKHYNVNPSYKLSYYADLLTADALLHAIDTVRKYTPCPDMHRIPESIRHELSLLLG